MIDSVLFHGPHSFLTSSWIVVISPNKQMLILQITATRGRDGRPPCVHRDGERNSKRDKGESSVLNMVSRFYFVGGVSSK